MIRSGVNKKIGSSDAEYRIRILISICFSLLFWNVCFRFWPLQPQKDAPLWFDATESIVFSPDEIEITRQKKGVAPPPKPVLPNPSPSLAVVDEVIEFPEVILPESPLEGSGITIGNAPQGDKAAVMEKPARPASVLKIVEPPFPAEAQESGIHVSISVSFLVDEKGDVEDVYVNEIRQIDRAGRSLIVKKIGFGLVEITLNAASKWKFRPARHDGKAVKSWVKHEFTFGS